MEPILVDGEQQPVTAVISHLVKPGREKDYEQWLRDISAVAQQFEGHAGVSLIRPEDKRFPEYVIILKFDCYEHLKQWMDSEVRQRWIDKAKPLVQQDQNVQVLTGLETWFTLPGHLVRHPPPRYKMAVLTIAVIFFMSQISPLIFGRFLVGLAPTFRALTMTTINVFLMTYVVMPRVTRLFYRWLYAKQ